MHYFRLDCSLNTMAEKVEQSPRHLVNHVAVRMKDYIAVFVSEKQTGHKHEYWTYNLWTEQWKKCPIKQDVWFSNTQRMCGVAIQSVIYMFGGHFSSNLWKLTQSTDGSFEWNKILMEKHKMPSPRSGHCGWEHGDKMWIFGGYGLSPDGYINDHGDFHLMNNNQLFSYDPLMQIWKNIECYGDVPSPRESASAATINDKVWLHGGHTGVGWENKLYELSMNSFSWTHICIEIPRPLVSGKSALASLSDNHLVIHLHGGSHQGRSIWIFDVESYQLRQSPGDVKCYQQQFPSTGTRGLNRDAIILGGHHIPKFTSVFTVMLEPKRLQQLAMRIIHQHKKDLHWKSLPPQLIRKVFGTETE